MPHLTHAVLKAIYAVVLFIVAALFCIVLSIAARADDLTGLPQNDPKDLQPVPERPCATAPSSGSGLFVPMPEWARGVIMPQLPYQLQPTGKKPANAVAAAKPAPLAPPPETTTAAPAATPKPAPSAADSNPALVAVSPFLQWIQSNPQAAAQARQQANSYHPAPGPGSPNGAGTPGPGSAQGDPYWLPPLIDSSQFGASSGTGSAAIYSTPQR